MGARIKVFWQPGCTSCLRTKEFLTQQGIEYDSYDVHNDEVARAELAALGARSVPIVALAGKYTYAQSIRDVIKFLDLKTKVMDSLPPPVLAARLDAILRTAARLTAQMPPDQFKLTFRNRDRTAAGIAFHIGRVAEMGIEAAAKVPLRFESFYDLPPDEWGPLENASWIEDVRARVATWWKTEPDKTLGYAVPTYYGKRTMHDVLERTTWHAAQHTRQLMLILETYGVTPEQPLGAAELEGLPVPDEVWDR